MNQCIIFTLINLYFLVSEKNIHNDWKISKRDNFWLHNVLSLKNQSYPVPSVTKFIFVAVPFGLKNDQFL